MIKRTIKEDVYEYDIDGNLLKETVTETMEEDDTVYCYCNGRIVPNLLCHTTNTDNEGVTNYA